jgi:hypothetical protein
MKAWIQEFFQKANTPMDNETSQIFMKMLFLEASPNDVNLQPFQSQFLYQVIEKRAEHIGLNLSVPAKIFLMFLTKSPGSAVMYLYAIRSKTNIASMQTIASLFPVGFVAEHEMEKLWDKQKGHTYNDKNVDNYLDVYNFQ